MSEQEYVMRSIFEVYKKKNGNHKGRFMVLVKDTLSGGLCVLKGSIAVNSIEDFSLTMDFTIPEIDEDLYLMLGRFATGQLGIYLRKEGVVEKGAVEFDPIKFKGCDILGGKNVRFGKYFSESDYLVAELMSELVPSSMTSFVCEG